MQHVVYLFDRFQLDVTRRKLLSSGGLVLPLRSRPLEALLLLVANAGQIVDRRRLMQTVWPDRIVEDNNLNQCILAIRKALGETAGSNHFVMTVPGRGFCFVCPVRVKTQESIEGGAHVTGLPDPGVAPTAGATELPGLAATIADPLREVVMPVQRWLGRSFWLGVGIGAVMVGALLLPFALH